MFKKFKQAPVAYLVTIMTVLLAALVYVQGTGLVTGAASTWLTVAVGLLQVVLGSAVHSKVTPVANPKDSSGRSLVPLSTAVQSRFVSKPPPNSF